MPSWELNLWIAYASVEPLPSRKSDIQTARILHGLATPWTKRKLKARQFLDEWWEKTTLPRSLDEPEEAAETRSSVLASKWRQIVAAMGGQIEHHRDADR